MKTLLALVLGAGLCAAAPPGDPVAHLDWLAGQWATTPDHAGQWTEEVWVAPRAGMMLGLSRAGRGGRTTEYEFIRLEAGEDGVPVYWASPGGQPPVGFRLVAADERSATFENRAHDYPQRIQYRRDGTTLVATISAADGSQAESWTYRRQ